MFDYFSNLPNEKKTELFHEVVIAICELLYSGRYYFLHDLGMPNEEMLARGYATEAEMLAEGAEIQHLKNKDLTLQDILQHMLADDIFLVHSQGGTPIPLDMINRLTLCGLLRHVRPAGAGAPAAEPETEYGVPLPR